jgi:D-erythro-7,8-dihydroneopterin triphosphate epimerase
MAIIRIKDLLIPTIIGFNPEERINLQDVVVNVEIEVDISAAIISDQEDGIYNYKTITKQIISLVSESKYNLLERLTHEILELILEDQRVIRSKVEVDKPGALRFSESVSIELEGYRK